MGARVPVLKVVDCRTGVECDISVENKDGISRSLIFRFVSSIDERFRILCYLVTFSICPSLVIMLEFLILGFIDCVGYVLDYLANINKFLNCASCYTSLTMCFGFWEKGMKLFWFHSSCVEYLDKTHLNILLTM